MRELLIQFIVPLTFLAIWALTSILNRDGQPLPQRPQRPGDPRPDPLAEARRRREKARAASQRPWDAHDGPSPEGEARTPPARPAAAGPTGRPPQPSGGRPRPERPTTPQPVPAGFDGAGVYVKNDEVVFLDPATGRQLMSAPIDGESPTEAPKPPAPPRQRKASRGRRAPTSDEAGRAAAEAETRRALSDRVGRAMDLRRNERLELKPLAPKLQGLTGSLSEAVSLKDDLSPISKSASAPTFDAHAIQDMIAERQRLREIAVLSEVLRPPVSLRRGRGL